MEVTLIILTMDFRMKVGPKMARIEVSFYVLSTFLRFQLLLRFHYELFNTTIITIFFTCYSL